MVNIWYLAHFKDKLRNLRWWWCTHSKYKLNLRTLRILVNSYLLYTHEPARRCALTGPAQRGTDSLKLLLLVCGSPPLNWLQTLSNKRIIIMTSSYITELRKFTPYPYIIICIILQNTIFLIVYRKTNISPCSYSGKLIKRKLTVNSHIYEFDSRTLMPNI